jgi:4'-phosphopantetheinyl transferase
VREALGQDLPRYLATREPRVRARLLGARLMVRHVVAAVTGVEPGRVEVGRDGHGRPTLRRPAGLDVNISHTGGVLVVGVARGRRIGVDVEAAERPMSAPGFAERFCHPAELAELRGLEPSERNLRTLQLWTLKEACTKALGVGLAHDFTDLRLRSEPPYGVWRLDSAAAEDWQLSCDLVAGAHLIAAALAPPGGE